MSDFDVFISYTKRRDVYRARSLHRFLTTAGYRVWFDEDILNRKDSWVPVAKDLIIAKLKEAIEKSLCVVLFEMQAEAVYEYPGLDVERAIRNLQCMRSDQGTLIAWSWPIFESRCARNFLTISEGTSWESIAKNLHNLGIEPRHSLAVPQTGVVRRTIRWITRKKRVSELLVTLEAPAPDNTASKYTKAANLAFELHRAYDRSYFNRKLALVGEYGSGRSTLLYDGLSLFTRHISEPVLLVKIPEPDDSEYWTSMLARLPDRSVIAVDDFLDQTASYAPSQFKLICDALEGRFRREWVVVFVLTEEEAVEHLQPPRRDREDHYLDGIGEIHVWRPGPWRSYELESIVEAKIKTICADRSISWEAKEWNSREFVSALEDLPFFGRLAPVDYTTLQGQMIGTPRRLLVVLEEVVSQATVEELGRSRVTDETVEATLAKLTGFNPVLFNQNPSDRDDPIDEMSTQAAADTGLTKAVLSDFLRKIAWSLILSATEPIIGYIRDRAARRQFAQLIAERMLGSVHAIIFLDYENLDEQPLTRGGTEALNWVMRAVARYPYWVINIDSINKAQSYDQAELKEMMHHDSRSKPNPFRHCVILLDDVPEFLKSEADDLNSGAQRVRLNSFSKYWARKGST
jgi:hypothetical protein